MLDREELFNVNWSKLTHAFGAANDVPVNLVALTSKDEDIYNEGIDFLYQTICHQGTIYQATSYTIPFLIDIARSEIVLFDVKRWVIKMIYDISGGSDYSLNTIPKPSKFSVQARNAIVNEVDSLLDMLENSDTDLKCLILMLLSALHEESQKIFEALTKTYENSVDYEVREASLEAIRILKTKSVRKEPFFQQIFRNESDQNLKAIAALGLVNLNKQNSDPEVFEYLLNWTKERINQNPKRDLSFWKSMELTLGTMAVLWEIIKLSTQDNLEEFTNFISLIRKPSEIFSYVRYMLFHLFPNVSEDHLTSRHFSSNGTRYVEFYNQNDNKKITLDRKISSVSPSHLEILKLISSLDLFWETESNLLNVFGLPHSKHEIEKLIKQ